MIEAMPSARLFSPFWPASPIDLRPFCLPDWVFLSAESPRSLLQKTQALAYCAYVILYVLVLADRHASVEKLRRGFFAQLPIKPSHRPREILICGSTR